MTFSWSACANHRPSGSSAATCRRVDAAAALSYVRAMMVARFRLLSRISRPALA
jgi:hypothetical protein